MRVAITGSTGLIGSALVPALRAAGHEVVPLVRGDARNSAGSIRWDPGRGLLDPRALDGFEAVVHLAGVPVDARWTADYKRAIRSSRVDSTALLTRTLVQQRPTPRVFLVASAVGIYGDRGDEILDEHSALGSDFLAEVGRAWEAAADPAQNAGIRTVHTRFGIVLSRAGGALARMLPPFELGAGGKIGPGTQWMSWVAREDAIRGIVYALENSAVSGPINVTSPSPVTNGEFARTLGHVLRRPTVATIPAFALRLAFGELADAALLASQRVVPRALTGQQFTFQYAELEPALRRALGKGDTFPS